MMTDVLNDHTAVNFQYISKLVQIKRTVKVTKGGKQQHFRVIIILGNNQSQINIGIGSAKTVPSALEKAILNGQRRLFTFPIALFKNQYYSFYFKYGAAHLFIESKPLITYSNTNTKLYTLLQLAGLSHLHVKQLGSKNILNNLKALILGLLKLKEYLIIKTKRLL